MRLKELRDNLDWLYRKYGDADVFITSPDGEKTFSPDDLWATLYGPVFCAVYIETGEEKRRKI